MIYSTFTTESFHIYHRCCTIHIIHLTIIHNHSTFTTESFNIYNICCVIHNITSYNAIIITIFIYNKLLSWILDWKLFVPPDSSGFPAPPLAEPSNMPRMLQSLFGHISDFPVFFIIRI